MLGDIREAIEWNVNSLLLFLSLRLARSFASCVFGYFSFLFSFPLRNDNGVRALTSHPRRLFRTDVFPGLGWMLRAQFWQEELRHKWPTRATTGR